MVDETQAQVGPTFDPDRDIVTDAAALAGLAHPLRLRLLGLLRAYGPSTATKLAARCGESSGLTSYHLRQLAAAGFVVDADPADLAGVDRAGGRERWWTAARRSTYTVSPPAGDETAVAATADYLRAVLAADTAATRSWLLTQHAWPQQWQDLATISDVPLRLSPTEAAALTADIAALLARYRRHDPAQQPGVGGVPADAVIVTAQYQVFPLPDQDPPAIPPAAPRAIPPAAPPAG